VLSFPLSDQLYSYSDLAPTLGGALVLSFLLSDQLLSYLDRAPTLGGAIVLATAATGPRRRRNAAGASAATTPRLQRQSRTAASPRSPMKGLHLKAGGGAAGALPPRHVYLFGGVRGAAGARLGQRLAAAGRHRSRLAHPPIIVTPTRKARAHGHEQQLGRSSPSCRDGLALRMTSPKEIEMPS